MQQLTPPLTKHETVRSADHPVHHNTTKSYNNQAKPPLPQNRPPINLKQTLETKSSSRKSHKTEPIQTAKTLQMENGKRLPNGREHARFKIRNRSKETSDAMTAAPFRTSPDKIEWFINRGLNLPLRCDACIQQRKAKTANQSSPTPQIIRQAEKPADSLREPLDHLRKSKTSTAKWVPSPPQTEYESQANSSGS